LKLVLHKVIGDKQSTFLKNRELMDLVVVADEVIDNHEKEKEGLRVH